MKSLYDIIKNEAIIDRIKLDVTYILIYLSNLGTIHDSYFEVVRGVF